MSSLMFVVCFIYLEMIERRLMFSILQASLKEALIVTNL